MNLITMNLSNYLISHESRHWINGTSLSSKSIGNHTYRPSDGNLGRQMSAIKI